MTTDTETTTQTEAIEAKGLAKTYGDGTEAVEELTFVARSGEILGLLGPNGAGKTTSIGMLTTRIPPTGGQARVAGYSIAEDPIAVRGAIGIATQANTLDRALTVAEALYYHCRYHGFGRAEAREAADAAMERLGLLDIRRRPVAVLSGGFVRRLLLARAVAHRPRVVFLDEPTLGLDPHGRADLWRYVRALRDDGVSILLTTHYIHEAEAVCDRVAILANGRILTIGSPAELTARVGTTDLVIELDRDAAAVKARLQGVDSTIEGIRVEGDTLHCTCSDADAALRSILAAVAAAGSRVHLLGSAETPLESVFLGMTEAAR